jgi:S-adenosylmethionine synthetase
MTHHRKYLFTSESVTEGHPDKMADQISDAVLDAVLKDDPNGRVACETLVTTGLCLVAGEISTNTYVDIPKVARETIKEIGYEDPLSGYEWEVVGVMTSIQEQSPDIAQGVDEFEDHEQGAGDQGLMFGYATNETPELMPMPIKFAHRLTQRLAEVRKKRMVDYLRPDGKSQVTIQYEDGKPSRVEAVVIAAHHCPDVPRDTLKGDIIEKVIRPVISDELIDEKTKIFINETGAFIIGGPRADTGLTGRKIIVDTYGGVGSHGGGCFSGKDPSKVDRSGSYAARHIAKNVVAAGLADRCEVQVAYAIGIAKPVSIMVDCMNTNKIPEEKIEKIVANVFDLRPKAIISRLDLLRPIYKKTAAYGHFGREDPDFTWEKKDYVDILRDKAGV